MIETKRGENFKKKVHLTIQQKRQVDEIHIKKITMNLSVFRLFMNSEYVSSDKLDTEQKEIKDILKNQTNIFTRKLFTEA